MVPGAFRKVCPRRMDGSHRMRLSCIKKYGTPLQYMELSKLSYILIVLKIGRVVLEQDLRATFVVWPEIP
jgi:hypothetical protein